MRVIKLRLSYLLPWIMALLVAIIYLCIFLHNRAAINRNKPVQSDSQTAPVSEPASASSSAPVSEPASSSAPDNSMREAEEALFRFVESVMASGDGAIRTFISKDKSDTRTLSESIGLYMEYCLLRNHKQIFRREFDFLRNNLLVSCQSHQFIKWMDSRDVACNALIDDLRIIRCLLKAGDQWGIEEYHETAAELQRSLLEKQTLASAYISAVDGGGGSLISDFFEWERNVPAGSIQLCYLDFFTMYLLGQLDRRWDFVAARGFNLIRFSEMLDKYYDYGAQKYVASECLTDEVITAIHLAEMNEDTSQFRSWLSAETEKPAQDGKVRVYAGGVYAGAGIDRGGGKRLVSADADVLRQTHRPVESTAVYALCAVYSIRVGELEMAMRLMDRALDFCVRDDKSKYFGGFGDPSSGFYSFDNLTALIALAKLNLKGDIS